MPPTPPQVSYEDGQLTINAANSTLGDILKAVHAVTGAEIDIPPTASRERMAAQLGPGPAREVLSSLLAWTDYNYLIQAADTDPQGVQSIMLMARSKTTPAAPGLPGRTQAASSWTHRAPENTTPEREQEQSEGSTEASAEPATSGSPQPAVASGSPQSAPAPNAQQAQAPAAVAANPPAADSNTAATGTGDQTVQADAAPPASSVSASDPADKNAERMMQLQSLYEQRRQMIEGTRKSSSSN